MWYVIFTTVWEVGLIIPVMYEEHEASRNYRTCPGHTDVESRCDPGFPDSRTHGLPCTVHSPVPLTSLSVCLSSVSSIGPSVSTCPLRGGVYRILFRVPVSSCPIPEILNLKSAVALDFGDSVTFYSRVHTVMCVCLCVFLKKEAIAFLIEDRLRFC